MPLTRATRNAAPEATLSTKWGNPHPLSLGRDEAVRRYRADMLEGRLAISLEDVERAARA